MSNFLKFFAKKEIFGLFLIIIISLVIYKTANIFIEKIINRSKSGLERKRKKTVIELLKNLLRATIIVIAVIFILDLYGINVKALVASLGVASAVGALSLQDTLKDIINGAKMITDNYYMVGDYVKYNDFTGQVIQFGLRSTKIMDFDGRVLIIANRNIDSIINLSQKTASSEIDIPTAYEAKVEDVEKVISSIIKEIKTWPTVDKEKTKYLGIISFNDSSISYGIRFYCSPGKVWQYKRDILRLVKIKYYENNIEIPYTKIEVYNAKH